jgi:exopolyphosphatase/guanosine-5'-triphosphate,3'-diphosphate pyrophosphatase
MRVAAVDCGTNSIRLLVADVDPAAGTLTDVERSLEIVRLGEGVDRTGRLAPAALGRTLAALRGYADRITALGATRVRMVATSATRDASNRADFVAGVTAVLGVAPEVVTGAEEARLSFAGATADLPGTIAPPYLVVDIGGGSTELVLGGAGPQRGQVVAERSVDVGCVRLTERYLHDDPPTADQVRAATAAVDQALDEAARTVPLDQAATLVGLAGSVTTVAALHLRLDAYRADLIHHSRVGAGDVREISEELLAADHAQRAASPVLHPGRVDVIAAGALVLRRVLDRTGLPEVVVSERDILDGVALSLASP